MSKKFRIPRKLKKKIPSGPYCYKSLRVDPNTGTQYIKSCLFFNYIMCKDKPEEKQDEIDKEFPNESVGWCKMLKCEIDDQCKSCGVNFDL